MTTHAESFNARSWLFAPGDSERKMEKATAARRTSSSSISRTRSPRRRSPRRASMVAAFLKANAQHRARLWVRINPIQGPHALADLAAVMPAAPAGIMFPKPRGRADAELLDHYLTAFEAAAGIDDRRHQGDAARDRDAREHARDRQLCRRAARGRHVLGRRRSRDRARRQRQSRRLRRLRLHLRARAQPLPASARRPPAWPRSRRSTATSATKRACASARRRCGAPAIAACWRFIRRRSM